MNKIDKVVLDNGLTIYFYLDKRRHSTFFQFITKVGGLSKDFIFDNKTYHMQDGIAHILEHYIVECNPNGNFLDLLGERQMNTNASTSFDMTNFYFDAVIDVEFGIQTMLEGINQVKFSKEKLEKLKNPIYQEIRGRSDNKFYDCNIKTNDNLFNNMTFRSIGGTLEEVEKTTIDDLELYYKAFYQPKNQVIVVAGNFDKDKILKQITNYYKKKRIKEHSVKLLDIKEPIQVKRKEAIVYHPTPLKYVLFSFKIDISNYTPLEMINLDFYLGCYFHQFFGVISPLYKKLVESKIISAGIQPNYTLINNYLILGIGAYVYDEDVFKKEVLDTLKNIDNFNERYFELDRKSAIIRIILRDENIIKMIIPFVDNLINFNYPYLDQVEDLEKVTFKEFKEYILKLDFSNYTVVVIDNPKK